MILEHVVNCIDEIYNEVTKSPSVEMQKWVHKLKGVMDEGDSQRMMKKGIITSLTLCLSQGIVDDEFFESALIQNYEFILQKVPDMKKSMILKVKLDGLDGYLYREIKVPYGIILADLSYIILASMNAEGNHLFSMTVNGEERFGCDDCDDEFTDAYAADVTIPELGIVKGDKMELWYDFGEDYLFNIEVLDIEEHDHVQSFDDVLIIDGKGYGIWEDAHRLLNLYYSDRKEFLKTIEEYGLSDSDFVFEEFDVDTYNEMLLEDFEFLKMTYEMNDEFGA